MRQIIIIGAFLAGLLGLFMSLCGGGFFVMMAYDSVRNIIRPGQQDQMFGALVFLGIPAAFAVGGAALFWVCFKFIRSSGNRIRKDNGER
jgi:hypothetical protein